MLRSIVTLGYLGFMAYSVDFVLRKHVYTSQPSNSRSNTVLVPALAVTAFAILSFRFFVERSSPSYYLYALFPCFFWGKVLRDPWPFARLVRDAQAGTTSPKLLGGLLAVLGALQAMVFGYSVRQVFAALLLGMGVAWPLLGMGRSFAEKHWKLVGAWTASCIVLAVFPLLPVEKGESIITM